MSRPCMVRPYLWWASGHAERNALSCLASTWAVHELRSDAMVHYWRDCCAGTPGLRYGRPRHLEPTTTELEQEHPEFDLGHTE